MRKKKRCRNCDYFEPMLAENGICHKKEKVVLAKSKCRKWEEFVFTGGKREVALSQQERLCMFASYLFDKK